MNKFCEDKTKHENDKCLESESNNEDKYRKLYCDYCNLETRMKYIRENNNFICQSCKMLLLDIDEFKIVESFNSCSLELYVTKDMLIFLPKNDFLKSLMKIYEDKIYISSSSNLMSYTNNSGFTYMVPQKMRECPLPQMGVFPLPHMMNS